MGKQLKQLQTIFLDSKITADSDCIHEIKRHVLLGNKAMTNLESIVKSRDITDKSTQTCGFSGSRIQMLKLDHKENWALKNWCFELWCWRRLLRVSWAARRSKHSILKEISPEYSLKGLMLKLQYFGHLMWRTKSLEKTLMLGKTEGRRRTDRQKSRWLYGITNSMSLSKLLELVMDMQVSQPESHWVAESQTWLKTELNW